MASVERSYGSRDESAKGHFGDDGNWYPHREVQKPHLQSSFHLAGQGDAYVGFNEGDDSSTELVLASSATRMSEVQAVSLPVSVGDVPFHHAQEMKLLVASLNHMVGKEKAFPIKLHSQRVASDAAVADIAKNFDELIKLLETEVIDVEKTDKPTASAIREIVAVLMETFSQFKGHVLQRDSTSAQEFQAYKKILSQQYGAAMALEIANLHNGLSTWRQSFLQQQIENNLTIQRGVEVQSAADSELHAQMKKAHNTLALRYGLLVTEKKSVDQQLSKATKAELAAYDQYADAMADNDKLKDKLKETTSRLNRVEADNNDLEKTVQSLNEKCERASLVALELKTTKAAYESLKSTNEVLRKAADLGHAKILSHLAVSTMGDAEQLLKKIDDLDSNVRHLQQKNIDAVKAHGTLRDDLKQKDAEVADLKLTISGLNATAAFASQTHDDKVEEAKKLSKQVNDLDTEFRGLQQKHLDLKNINANLKAELASANRQKDEHKAERDARDKLLQASDDKVAALTQDKKARGALLNDLGGKITALEADISKLTMRADSKAEAEKAERDARDKLLQVSSDKLAALTREKKALGTLLEKSGEKIVALEKDVSSLKLQADSKADAEKKMKALAAENARLSFQLSTDKAAFDLEKKQLWEKIKQEKLEAERLEADVHRLATKLLSSNESDKVPRGNENRAPHLSARSASFQQPDNFVFRKEPFDYDVVPNPNSSTKDVNRALTRVLLLEEQLKMYRLLLEEGDKYIDAPGIRAKLLQTGLLLGRPYRQNVKPQWYDAVENAKKVLEQEYQLPPVDARSTYAKPSPVEVVALNDEDMAEWDEIC